MLGKKVMIDLISRKKLLDELRLYPTNMSDDDYDFVERLINSQRTIIPIQHAHWIVVGGDLGYTEALIEYIENSTFDGIGIDINTLKKTIVSLKETKELIEYINALFLNWDDTITDIYLLGEHIYNSKD